MQETKDAAQPPKGEKKEDNKPVIFSLPEFVVRSYGWEQAKSTEADEALVAAWDVTCQSLRVLAKWVKDPFAVSVGLVKETRTCGNTSVSMGLFERMTRCAEGARARFLNCGTGGIKFQEYRVENGCVCIQELKPGKAAPSAQTGQPDELEAYMDSTPELEHWGDESDRVPVYAFVTGPRRQAWEDADEEERERMNEEMYSFFPDWVRVWSDDDLSLSPKDPFLPQEVEAALEWDACDAMYRRLSVSVPLAVTFGIGQGSSQWTSPGYDCHARAGMNDVARLRQFPKRLETFLGGLPDNKLVGLVALKSGTLLLPSKDRGLLAWLTRDIDATRVPEMFPRIMFVVAPSQECPSVPSSPSVSSPMPREPEEKESVVAESTAAAQDGTGEETLAPLLADDVGPAPDPILPNEQAEASPVGQAPASQPASTPPNPSEDAKGTGAEGAVEVAAEAQDGEAEEEQETEADEGDEGEEGDEEGDEEPDVAETTTRMRDGLVGLVNSIFGTAPSAGNRSSLEEMETRVAQLEAREQEYKREHEQRMQQMQEQLDRVQQAIDGLRRPPSSALEAVSPLTVQALRTALEALEAKMQKLTLTAEAPALH